MAYKEKASAGLKHYECVCRSHAWAYPFDEELQHWREMQALPEKMKAGLAEKGVPVYRPAPQPLPHVILLSIDDVALFKLRRWRVFKSPARKKAKFEVKRGVVGKALQRMVLPDAEIVQFKSNDGTDCRRKNLTATTMKEVCKSRAQRFKKDRSHVSIGTGSTT